MKNTKVIKGDLILKEHFKHDGDLRVEGDIRCENGLWDIDARNIDARNIKAWDIDARDIDAWNIDARDIDAGDIEAWDIDARNIDARNIKAWDIDARDIDAGDIDARNIKAGDIICEKRIKKDPQNKTIARIFITERSKLKRKEWIEELDNKQVSNLRNVSFKVKVLEVAK